MAYEDGYLKEVTFYDGTTTYTIPVWNLRLRAIPYHASGAVHLEYFYGKNVQRIQGFRIECEMDLNFSHNGTDNESWSDLLDDISNDVTWTIDFDPDNAGTRTGEFVMAESPVPLGANFSGHIRNRPMKTRWVSPDILADMPWFLGCEADPNPLSDLTDLLLHMPSTMSDSGGTLTEWPNTGSLGSGYNLGTVPAHAAGAPTVVTDGDLGDVIKFTATNQSIHSDTADDYTGLNLSTDTYEIWCVFMPDGTNGGNVWYWDLGTGQSTWNVVDGSTPGLSTTINNNERSSNVPDWVGAGGTWNVWRSIRVGGTSGNWTTNLNGVYVDSEDSSSTMSGVDGYHGMGDPFPVTSAALNLQIGMFKAVDGLLSKGRSREIYAYMRDTWNMSQVPADGTPVGALVGNPPSGDIHRSPFSFDATGGSTVDNQVGSVALGHGIYMDQENEVCYYMEGGTSIGRMKRMDFSGGERQYISTFNSPGGRNRGLAVDVAGNRCFVAGGSSTSGDTIWLCDALTENDGSWSEIFATGTYETEHTLYWHIPDQLLYFIDSLAATPSLRTITAAGASDTKIADLTAGKVYGYMFKDTTANILYFTNETDSTIEKYHLDTDTHSTAWHSPAGGVPKGLTMYDGQLYYFEDTTFKIWQVDVTTPGSRTELSDMSTHFGGSFAGDLGIQIFDTSL